MAGLSYSEPKCEADVGCGERSSLRALADPEVARLTSAYASPHFGSSPALITSPTARLSHGFVGYTNERACLGIFSRRSDCSVHCRYSLLLDDHVAFVLLSAQARLVSTFYPAVCGQIALTPMQQTETRGAEGSYISPPARVPRAFLASRIEYTPCPHRQTCPRCPDQHHLPPRHSAIVQQGCDTRT